MTENSLFRNKDICLAIEEFKAHHPDLTYIDCVLEVCERQGVELVNIKQILSKNIKEKIEAEASTLRLIKGDYATVL